MKEKCKTCLYYEEIDNDPFCVGCGMPPSFVSEEDCREVYAQYNPRDYGQAE